jgi:hypothetical protein
MMRPAHGIVRMDRYLNKWLPTLLTATEEDDDKSSLMMIPRPGVVWLWYCHRLSPQYESYTKRSIGKVIEAYPTFSFQMSDPYNVQPLLSKTESDAEVAMKAMNNHHQDLCGHHKVDNFYLANFCFSQAKLRDCVSQPCFAQVQSLCQAVDKYH